MNSVGLRRSRKARKDFTELRRWVRGGEPPESVVEFVFDPKRLREITPKQQSVYKALMALVLRHGAKDFHHASTLTPSSIVAQSVDDHHIFPKAFLNPSGGAPSIATNLVDCILNRTLIDSDTNRRIGKRGPSDYLADIEPELTDDLETVLDSHLISNDAQQAMADNEFSIFLEAREISLVSEMSEATKTDIARTAKSSEEAQLADARTSS